MNFLKPPHTCLLQGYDMIQPGVTSNLSNRSISLLRDQLLRDCRARTRQASSKLRFWGSMGMASPGFYRETAAVSMDN